VLGSGGLGQSTAGSRGPDTPWRSVLALLIPVIIAAACGPVLAAAVTLLAGARPSSAVPPQLSQGLRSRPAGLDRRDRVADPVRQGHPLPVPRMGG
jgi:hypothetical protein